MKQIGFWGYPNPEIVQNLKKIYPHAEWIDLDIDFGYPECGILPDSYCKIIKNVVYNAIHFGMEDMAIVATIGKDKCDSGWLAAQVLKDIGFKVFESKFENLQNRKPVSISTSGLPLYDKIVNITGNIIDETNFISDLTYVKPEFGFWGVPPNDLEILKLFPDNTHVYGWTRCVEAGVPADIALEMFVDENVPTVFYSQAFCAKSQLAKYLADKFNGLYIDIDDYATNSVRAKIEAFLRLR